VTDPNDSTNTINFQSRGAWMSGVEIEGTYYVGDGLSVYANGSLNRATYKTHPGVPSFNVASLGAFGSNGVPNSTAAIGAVFNRSGWFASITDKYIGPFVVYSSALINPDLGLNGQTATGHPGGPIVPVLSSENGGFALVDVAGGYVFKMAPGSFLHSIKVKLQVDNALDRKVQVLSAVAAQTASITSGNSFNVLPRMNFFLTVSGEF
jgi:iron complex outermembrane receptor protein